MSEWKPVKDMSIDCGCDEDCGCSLTVEEGYITLENEAGYWSTTLPDGFAVCQLVEVDRPRPDWSIAPKEAMWWAVDPDGYCHWFENEPILEQVTSAPDIIGPRWSHHGSKWIRYEAVNIPLGIDWRELCEKRPEATDAVG